MTKRNAVVMDKHRYPIFFAFNSSTGTMAKALKGIDQDPDDLSEEDPCQRPQPSAQSKRDFPL